MTLKKILLPLLVFALACMSARAQETYTGVIVDMNGDPIPGVAVFTGGNGTISNDKGEYSIAAKSGDEIQFNCLGYETVTIKAGSPQLKRVEMKDDAMILETAVVTALGIKRDEKSLGYSAQKVESEKFAGVATTGNWLNGISGEGADMSYCTNNAGGTVTRTNQVASTQTNRYNYLAGIAGANAAASTIDHCENKAKIQNNIPGTSNLTTVDLGGIIGWGQFKATITNCSNSGEIYAVDGNNTVKYPRTALGGIIGSGSAANTTIKNSSNSAQVYCEYYKKSTKCNGRLSYVGGIAGALAEFSNYGDTQTKLITGGLAGFEITSCTNTGIVHNRNYNNTVDGLTTSPFLGGIVGVICGTSESKAKVHDCNTSLTLPSVYTIYRGHGGGIAGYA